MAESAGSLISEIRLFKTDDRFVLQPAKDNAPCVVIERKSRRYAIQSGKAIKEQEYLIMNRLIRVDGTRKLKIKFNYDYSVSIIPAKYGLFLPFANNLSSWYIEAGWIWTYFWRYRCAEAAIR